MQQSTAAPDAPSHPTGATGGASSQHGDGPRASRTPRTPGPPGPPPSGERRQRALGWRSRDILRATALVIGLYLTLRLLWLVNPLVLTAFLGILFGLAVEAAVDRLERWRIPRGVGAAAVVLGFYAFLIGIGAWMAPTIREQARELRRELPAAVDKIEGWINQRQSGLFGFILGGSEVVARQDSAAAGSRASQGGAAGGAAPAAAADTGQGSAAGAQAPGSPVSMRDRIGSQMSGVSRYLFPFLTSTIAVLAGIVLITFLAIYIGADPDTYHRGLMHLFPHRSRQRAGEVLSAMAAVLRKWLITQLIAMFIIGAITTIVLLVLDVRAAFALGLIAGLLEFVPTIGPLLSAVPAVAMGFLDSPQKALYVALAYWGIQFLENNVVIPRLMSAGLDLPPALTILGQALLAIVFGFLGLMVAVPLIAAIMVPIKMLYVEDVVGDEVSVFEEGADDG